MLGRLELDRDPLGLIEQRACAHNRRLDRFRTAHHRAARPVHRDRERLANPEGLGEQKNGTIDWFLLAVN